jgi:hypothetical protein
MTKDLTVQVNRELAAPERGNTAIERMIELASTPGFDTAKLADLIAFQERDAARRAEIEFNMDFVAMKAEIPRIKKLAVKDMGEKGKIPYAAYDQIDEALRPMEEKYGFCRRFETRVIDGKLTMFLVVSHRGGHSVESAEPVMPDTGAGKNESQARGSGRSYSKRYLTLDFYDIVTFKDDDGKMAGAITQHQADELNTLISDIGFTAAGRTAFFKLADVQSVESIQKHRFDDIRQALLAKLRAKQ